MRAQSRALGLAPVAAVPTNVRLTRLDTYKVGALSLDPNLHSTQTIRHPVYVFLLSRLVVGRMTRRCVRAC